MNRMPPSAAMLLCLLAAACGAPASDANRQAAEPPLAGARIGGSFSLVDQNGRRVTDRDLLGRHAIVYFGYSFCPDICPVDLQKLAAGLRAFETADARRGASIVPVFITIDPARDTPAVLKSFAAAFHPRMIALSGTDAEIAAAAKAYGVYYAKAADAGTSDYLMDHSRQAYLFGPDGKPIALLPTDKGPGEVAAELARWVR